MFFVCLLLAGCGSSSGSSGSSATGSPPTSAPVSSSSPAAPSSQSGSPPKCAALPADPDWSKKLRDGACQTAGGDYVTTGSFDCKDGSKLYQFDVGAVAYWGVPPGRLMRSSGPVGKDPRYAAAYSKCMPG